MVLGRYLMRHEVLSDRSISRSPDCMAATSAIPIYWLRLQPPTLGGAQLRCRTMPGHPVPLHFSAGADPNFPRTFPDARKTGNQGDKHMVTCHVISPEIT
jgi:hypothetical protein